jgi:hypothetical protein
MEISHESYDNGMTCTLTMMMLLLSQDLVRPHATSDFAPKLALRFEGFGVEVRSWLSVVEAIL